MLRNQIDGLTENQVSMLHDGKVHDWFVLTLNSLHIFVAIQNECVFCTGRIHSLFGRPLSPVIWDRPLGCIDGQCVQPLFSVYQSFP